MIIFFNISAIPSLIIPFIDQYFPLLCFTCPRMRWIGSTIRCVAKKSFMHKSWIFVGNSSFSVRNNTRKTTYLYFERLPIPAENFPYAHRKAHKTSSQYLNLHRNPFSTVAQFKHPIIHVHHSNCKELFKHRQRTYDKFNSQ